MILKDIIIKAAETMQRADIVEGLVSGTLNDEQSEVVKLLLLSVNSVEDELARYYFPLKERESVAATNRRVYFDTLKEKLVRVLGVYDGEEKLRFHMTAKYVEVYKDRVEIEYEYIPSQPGTLESTSMYDGSYVSENLIAAGALAEYFIIIGEIELSEYWESRYKKLIEGARKVYTFSRFVPERRWV